MYNSVIKKEKVFKHYNILRYKTKRILCYFNFIRSVQIVVMGCKCGKIYNLNK